LEDKKSSVYFDCYDNDEVAIEYAKKILNNPNVTFVKQNVVRLALKKNIYELISSKYDIIYSIGLFDYLYYNVAVRLIAYLSKLLLPGGLLAIFDVHEKFANPSVYFMEWIGDWNLIYRHAEEFRRIFLDAGFEKSKLQCRFEQQGLMQYI